MIGGVRRADPHCQETVRRSAGPGGNGECVPRGRTPSHASRGGASRVPCALTMRAAPSLWSRRHAHRREIVPPCPGRIHDDGGAVTMNAGGLTMTAAERAGTPNHATRSRAPSPEPPRRPHRSVRAHEDGGASHYGRGARHYGRGARHYGRGARHYDGGRRDHDHVCPPWPACCGETSCGLRDGRARPRDVIRADRSDGRSLPRCARADRSCRRPHVVCGPRPPARGPRPRARCRAFRWPLYRVRVFTHGRRTGPCAIARVPGPTAKARVSLQTTEHYVAVEALSPELT